MLQPRSLTITLISGRTPTVTPITPDVPTTFTLPFSFSADLAEWTCRTSAHTWPPSARSPSYGCCSCIFPRTPWTRSKPSPQDSGLQCSQPILRPGQLGGHPNPVAMSALDLVLTGDRVLGCYKEGPLGGKRGTGREMGG